MFRSFFSFSGLVYEDDVHKFYLCENIARQNINKRGFRKALQEALVVAKQKLSIIDDLIEQNLDEEKKKVLEKQEKDKLKRNQFQKKKKKEIILLRSPIKTRSKRM